MPTQKDGKAFNRSGIQAFVFVIAILIGVTGCYTTQKKTIIPNIGQAELLRHAKPCNPAAQPTGLKYYTEWKYGCFCGEGHPGYKKIEEYYSVKPKDDIDIACREHDVCWVLNGENDGHCCMSSNDSGTNLENI